MLYITVPAMELFDDEKQEFITLKEQTLQLEHSLVSLSKWESKWCKPFLTDQDKTEEEVVDYIKCMTITQNVKADVYERLTKENVDQIKEYISAPMTATRITKNQQSKPNREQITAEIIHYWMIALNIPPEYQKWHLNRLITLIEVCNIKNQPPKKMGRQATMRRNASLNAARRKQLNTKG